MFGGTSEYLTDAIQRGILFWDVMRRRGNMFREQAAKEVPHVLNYEIEPIMDGRRLDRPVNYGIVRIIPPQGVEIDQTKRPFVVVDPRAGHGPGIGGFIRTAESLSRKESFVGALAFKRRGSRLAKPLYSHGDG